MIKINNNMEWLQYLTEKKIIPFTGKKAFKINIKYVKKLKKPDSNFYLAWWNGGSMWSGDYMFNEKQIKDLIINECWMKDITFRKIDKTHFLCEKENVDVMEMITVNYYTKWIE